MVQCVFGLEVLLNSKNKEKVLYISLSPSPKTKTKRRILVVDDESDITFTLKKGLENSGIFEVDTFNDPQEALSSFKPDYYDWAQVETQGEGNIPQLTPSPEAEALRIVPPFGWKFPHNYLVFFTIIFLNDTLDLSSCACSPIYPSVNLSPVNSVTFCPFMITV